MTKIDETLGQFAGAVSVAWDKDAVFDTERVMKELEFTKQALYKDMVELIEDNIIYGNEQISKDELLEAVRKYYGVEE